jgi:N-methylhydantoinase A
MPTAPEFERTSTTLVDAYVGPRVENYLSRLQGALREGGYRRDLLIMQSNGGIMTADFLAKRAVASLGSGPTGGVMGACAVARQAGVPDFIAIDMGGTSYEACLIKAGTPRIRSFWNWQHRYLVGLPMVEMHSIGAGGGSIAWIDSGGALRVGPRSAGSNPGPASYGMGGTEPTVSDANLVLGYLDEANLLGGSLQLRRGLAEEAIERNIAKPLGMSVPEAAYAIFSVVNHTMVEAIKVLSVQRGIDPRDYALIVGGGAGGIHASWLGFELEIADIVVPAEAGAFCALGMIVADVRHDFLRTLPQRSDGFDPAAVNALYAGMEAAATQALAEVKVDVGRHGAAILLACAGDSQARQGESTGSKR